MCASGVRACVCAQISSKLGPLFSSTDTNVLCFDFFSLICDTAHHYKLCFKSGLIAVIPENSLGTTQRSVFLLQSIFVFRGLRAMSSKLCEFLTLSSHPYNWNTTKELLYLRQTKLRRSGLVVKYGKNLVHNLASLGDTGVPALLAMLMFNTYLSLGHL